MSGTTSGGSGRAPSDPALPGDRSRPPRRVVRVAVVRAWCVAVGLVTGYYLLPMDDRRTAGTGVLLVCGLLAVVLVFCWEVRTIARSPHPRLRAIEGLTATLLLFLVLFAASYYLLARSAPDSFSEPLTRTDALYFTLTTFTTVGYGDISARSEAARALTMVQMAGGLLLVGVAVRVLAGAVQAGLARQHDEPPPPPPPGTDPTKRPEAGA
ncbi:potassium channel family protein [Streptomyces sp. 796.1]|uniref:potassium channel family protein n=1 Tax=Streptomyces sp. 796.1 TaxID=3163029 RepID=UPI0039C9B018